jgi:serine/threonine protein kinase/predicted RNA-binding Zn-ribbon protein involved in translation (DUF1610 family)
MAALLTCPDVQVLKRFVLGLDSGNDRDATAEHVEKCSKCMAVLKTISSTDTLVEAVRAQTTAREGPEQAVVKHLAAKVRAMLPEAKNHANPSQIRDAAMLTISCSSCKKKLRVTESVMGKKAKCPSCGKLTIVSTPAGVGGNQEAPTIAPAPIPDGPTIFPSQPDASNVPTDSQAANPDPTIAAGTENSGHDPALTDFLAPTQNPDELGRLGKYRILKVLGHGGMGAVFLGEDATLGRKVAIKVMLPHLAQSRSSQQRFLREAKTAATLEHDNIVPIFHVDEDRGAPYIVMPLLKGQPLDDRLRSDEPLPLADILRISRETARGLDAAHKTGLIHRDIKPANIWLESIDEGEEGKGGEFTAKTPRHTRLSSRVKILDFGLARASADESGLTQQGAVIGTPAFMAPEQGRGAQVDARCDLFSLGVVMYRMCTGDLPFRGADTVSTLMAVAMHDPVPPSEIKADVPSELSDLVMGLLEKEPGQRVASASEVVKRIKAIERKLVIHQMADDDGESFASSVDIKLPAKGKATAKPKAEAGARRRVPLVLGIGAIAALLLLTCGAGAFWLFQIIIVRDRDGKKIAEIQVPKDGKVEIKPDAPPAGPWQATAEQQAYLEGVAVLPPKERAASVLRKLRELNGKTADFFLEPNDDKPTRCRVRDQRVRDIWPLVAFTTLKSIDLIDTTVVDFRPLARLPLAEAEIRLILDNAASEEALKAMPTLAKINDTPAKDYWATRAEVRKEIDRFAAVSKGLAAEDQTTWLRTVMKKLHPSLPEKAFESLSVGVPEWTKLVGFHGFRADRAIFDFSPVRALTIDGFFLEGGFLFDATPLAKTKLKVLLVPGQPVRDLTPLTGLPLEEANLASTWITDLRPLSGMKLKKLFIVGTPIADVSPLEGVPLEHLEMNGVADLKPLANMPLKFLKASERNSPVADLSPLKGMPLETLILPNSRVTDLSPLAGMKLKQLEFRGAPAVDLSPLKGMPLTSLDIWRAIVDPTLATLPLKELFLEPRLFSPNEDEVLRGLKVAKINGMTPNDFWKAMEARRKAAQDKIDATVKKVAEARDSGDQKRYEQAVGDAMWECGQYPTLKYENNELVEAAAGGGMGAPDFYNVAAFPKLRKLKLHFGGDYSVLRKCPELQEFEGPEIDVAFNREALKLLPKLKTINGKPAQEVLGK